MTRPHKHPRTGIYLFRKRVPDRLRAVVGKGEEVRSLGTKDPEKAKALCARMALEVEARWANLSRGPQALTHRQVHAIAGEIYRAELAANDAASGDPARCRLVHFLDVQALLVHRRTRTKVCANRSATGWSLAETGIRSRFGGLVEAYLSAKGLIVSDADYKRVVLAAAEAATQAHGIISRQAAGDFSPDPQADRFPLPEALEPVLATSATVPPTRAALPWRETFDAYAREAGLPAKTRDAWRSVIGKAMAFAGTNDLFELTHRHLLDYKAALVAQGLHQNTIRNGRLGPVKALCNWAVENRKLDANPATGVKVRKAKVGRGRDKGFTLDEAEAILRCALLPPNPRASADRNAARRWVPWICAYTGARVNEITQMRAEDVRCEHLREHGNIWTLRITPEAGSTKTGEFRDVALHPHLLEMGFLTYVHGVGKGPLFYDPSRSRRGTEKTPLYRKTGEFLARWVRKDVGITDPRIDPNHAWRHRFKSVCREARVPDEIRDRIQGHVPRTAGEDYGDLWPQVMQREISAIPRYEVAVGPRRGELPSSG